MVFLKIFFEKVDLEKNQQTAKKYKNFPGGKELIFCQCQHSLEIIILKDTDCFCSEVCYLAINGDPNKMLHHASLPQGLH